LVITTDIEPPKSDTKPDLVIATDVLKGLPLVFNTFTVKLPVVFGVVTIEILISGKPAELSALLLKTNNRRMIDKRVINFFIKHLI
jgi:hypothetical protein